MIVAIHQPNFFPWLGFFDKISRCDRFVVLDNVQFPRGAGNWGNRVKCIISNRPQWLTAPIDRSSGSTKRYDQVQFHTEADWRDRVLTGLKQSYPKARYGEEGLDLLGPLIRNPENILASYNVAAITGLLDALGLDRGKLVLASSLPSTSTGTERLIELTKLASGTVYLSGGGASGYQEDDLFSSAGIELRYQDFQHPAYSQVGTEEFVPGLSIIDPILNLGIAGTRSLLKI